jgi:hypothetical protein
MRRIFESLGAAVLVAVWLTHAARAAEQFALEVPGDPSLSSAALWDGQELTVVDAQGQRFVYLRRPDHDSPDGRFWAYFSPQAGTFLRWPVSGRGPMESGTAVGNRIVWTLSKMQVRALGGPRAAAVNELPKDTGRMHVAAVAFDPQALAVAHIDGAGQLHFYRGLGDRWEHLPSTIRAELLVPGAPVDLLRNADSALPLLYTVGTNGDVYEVVEGRRLRRLIGLEGIAFRPGSDFAVVADNRQKSILMVDSRGRLWELDTTAGHHNLIDKRPGLFEPGAPVRVSGPEASQIFLVDRQGNLLEYLRDPATGWSSPELIGTGFLAGGDLDVWLPSEPVPNAAVSVASIDREGQLQILKSTDAGWTRTAVTGARFVPGSPVAALETSAGLSLSAVLPDGRWMEFVNRGGTWQERPIGAGFPLRAPVVINSVGPTGFAIDVAGRLIAATLADASWRTVLLTSQEAGPTVAPAVERRRLIRDRDLTPLTVEFVNPTSEELVIRVLDLRVPGGGQSYTIPPGSSVNVGLDSDQGGALEEALIIPGPAGPVVNVRQVPLPPQRFYDVVVYANRVTYQYIDRRQKRGPVPDFDKSSLVSLGTFPLPPGQYLRNGTKIDVYQAALQGRNPGLSALVNPYGP